MDYNKILGKKLNENCTRMLSVVLNKSLKQHPHKTSTVGPLLSHLTNHPKQTRHAVHCWRSTDELISNILLWTPTHGLSSLICIISVQILGGVLRTCLEWWMIDTDGKLELRKFGQSAWYYDDDDIYIYI